VKEFETLLAKVKRGEIAPLYYLWGEETYFIDQVLEQLVEQALAGGDRSFNFDQVFGNEAKAPSLIGLLRSYPVMATRRVVLMRDAHRLPKAEADRLVSYLEQPVPTTVFILVAGETGKPDTRTKWGKALLAKAESLESKKLREADLAKWVAAHAAQHQLNLTPDAQALLCEALGNNLSHIENELTKLKLLLPDAKGKSIGRAQIYDYVSIDREFNSFELIEKISERDLHGTLRIVQQMMKNPKENPPIPLVAQLFGFFTQLLTLYGRNARNENDVMQLANTNYMQAKRLRVALTRYNRPQTERVLKILQETDNALKGIGTGKADENHLLQRAFLIGLQG